MPTSVARGRAAAAQWNKDIAAHAAITSVDPPGPGMTPTQTHQLLVNAVLPGGTYTSAALYTVSWTSRDVAVATINASSGLVTAVASGSTVMVGQVTGTWQGRTLVFYVYKTITVAAPAHPTFLDVTPAAMILAVGQQVYLQVISRDGAGGTVRSGRTITAVSADPTKFTVGAGDNALDPIWRFLVTAVAETTAINITVTDTGVP